MLILFLALVGGSLPSQTNAPIRKYSAVERMQTAHLKAAHADALRLQQQRQVPPPLAGLHDYRCILHAHAEDSAHTGGTRPEMLVDARKAGYFTPKGAMCFWTPTRTFSNPARLNYLNDWESGSAGHP